MKTTATIGLLLALGMGAFISNASAEFPKPGEYKGTLTITKIMGDRNGIVPGPPIIVKTVLKASARLDAEGYLRVVYSGDRGPIFGRLRPSNVFTVKLGEPAGLHFHIAPRQVSRREGDDVRKTRVSLRIGHPLESANSA
jgi:hypothetical protein